MQLQLKVACTVKLPEKSHYLANATKQPANNTPNSNNYTSLKTSGTKLFGVMRPKLNFMVTTIDTMNDTYLTDSTRVCRLMSCRKTDCQFMTCPTGEFNSYLRKKTF